MANPLIANIAEAAQKLINSYNVAEEGTKNLPDTDLGKCLTVQSTEDVIANLSKYKLISFDVFDTLLVRDIYSPKDVFIFTARHAQNLIRDSKFDHRYFRISAEKNARQSSPRQDVSLEEIYRHYLLLTGIAADLVEEIKQHEIATEGKLLRARESAKKVFNSAKSLGLSVVIVSDFYMSEQIVRSYLENAGFDLNGVRLFVSSEIGLSKKDGDLYDHVAQTMEVAPGAVLHFGDNFLVDTKMALQHGIHSIHIPSPKATLDLAHDLKDYLSGTKQNQIEHRSLEWSFMLGGVINGLFDDHFAPPLDSAFAQDPYRFGYAVLGPLLASYTSWLRIQVEKNGTDTLLFLARDGWVMKAAFDAYQRISPLKKDIATQYIAASRRMMDILALANNFENVFRIINARYTSGKLSEFLNVRLGIDSNLITDEALLAGGFASADELVSLPRDRVRTLSVIQRLKAPIQENATSLAKFFKRYAIAQGIRPNTKVSVIDIGYFGSMQKAIAEQLRPMNTDVYGLYLAVRREAQLDFELKGKISGYLANNFNPRDGREPLYVNRLAVIEQFFSAPHASVSGLRYVNGKIEAEYFPEIGEHIHYDRLNAIHNGALDFVRRMADLEASLGERLDLELVQHSSTLDALFSRHEAELAQILDEMIFENRVNGESAQKHYPKPAHPAIYQGDSTYFRIPTEDLIRSLSLKNGALLDSNGRIEISKGSRGWVIYGPYISLPIGTYEIFIEYSYEGPNIIELKKPGKSKFIISNNKEKNYLAEKTVKLYGKRIKQKLKLKFKISKEKFKNEIEIKIMTNGKAKIIISKINIEKIL